MRQNYYLCVLLWYSLKIIVFWYLQKDLFKRRWSLAESFSIQNEKNLSCLSHKVCHLLSSPILWRKFTTVLIWEQKLSAKKGLYTNGMPAKFTQVQYGMHAAQLRPVLFLVTSSVCSCSYIQTVSLGTGIYVAGRLAAEVWGLGLKEVTNKIFKSDTIQFHGVKEPYNHTTLSLEHFWAGSVLPYYYCQQNLKKTTSKFVKWHW